jgi:hypothetical protein
MLRLHRGESLEAVSRNLAGTQGKLTWWRKDFLPPEEAAIKGRETDAPGTIIRLLESKVGDLTMGNELLQERLERLHAELPCARSRRSS